MRIISGSARGRKLGSFSGQGIRPTPDRVREAVFSMLFSRLGGCDGARVLDLFAGSGAMALEALSRGAVHATLVDQDRKAERLIRANLEHCGLADRARILRRPVDAALDEIRGGNPFTLVFLDPPYSRNLVEPTLAALIAGRLLEKNAIVVAESDRRDQPCIPPEGLDRIEERLFGRTRIELFQPLDVT